jgi:hypothetical protein
VSHWIGPVKRLPDCKECLHGGEIIITNEVPFAYENLPDIGFTRDCLDYLKSEFERVDDILKLGAAAVDNLRVRPKSPY